MEFRSVPGLVVSDIWKIQEDAKHGILVQTKSEGSNVNGTGSPRNIYQPLGLSALESRGSLYPPTSSGDIHESTPFGSGISNQSEIGSRSGSDYDGASLSRNESQSEKSVVPRMRSISDIVRETGHARGGEDKRQAEADVEMPSALDTLSLQDSGRFHNPSTSSQPESIDSVSVNITMNKDTASTVAQSGSIGEPDGSGQESSDLLTLAHRSSSSARRRRPSLQRRRRAETGAIRRRRRQDLAGDILTQNAEAGPLTHLALSHDDTSPGAQHTYQDEFGKLDSLFPGQEPT